MIIRKRNRPYTYLLLAMLGPAFSLTAYGQLLSPDQPMNRSLILAEEQYMQGHYTLARQSAEDFLSHRDYKVRSETSADADKALFLITISNLKTNEPDCLNKADKLLATTQNIAYKERTMFALAQYYFLHNQLTQAISYYEKAGLDNLTNSEIADLKFELAYCYFNNKQFDKATLLFAAIKEIKDGKYYMAGNYYYGLLAYNSNKYAEALQSFEKVRDDKEYRSIVPYYIAEIYYFMGNKTKAIEEGKAIIKARDKSYYDNEVHLLIAQCMFEDQQYVDAKPYFEHYYEHATQIKKEDLYKMAYCYYRLNDWQNAEDKFKLLSNANDSMGQSSMYLLGDCYMKTGDRQSARNAFGICADMPYNPGQQEASMILYARISYEAGYNDEALRQLYTLLKTFPSSQYKDEANTLLSSLLIKTNNFEEALKYLDKVNNKEKNYWMVFQKATYLYAVQLFRNGDLTKAYSYFNSSLLHPNDPLYECAAYFWKSELAYRMRKYGDAISAGKQFIERKTDKVDLSRVSPQATVQHAYLNMGFASMEGQNFSDAQTYFNNAQQAKGDDDYSGVMARLREADAVFMQQNYAKAITLYDKISTTDTANADYAKYQKSIILGLQGKNNEKINVLQSLTNRATPSVYNVTALYEMAVTYIELDKYPQALSSLKRITDSSNDKSASPKAWLKVGYIYQQTNDNNKAIDAYKRIVTEYPASEERIAALSALKSLYIQNNQPAAYSQLLKDNNLPSAESSSIDSTYYAAAEAQFAAGKWDNSMKAFSNYLQQYPNGVFAIKAHYYRGESNFQLRNFKEALDDFDSVLIHPWNDFSENSARHAAAMAYDKKDYTGAYNYYLKMRNNSGTNMQLLQTAYNGLVKSGYHSEKYGETSGFADSLLAMKGLPADMINETLLFKAKALQHFEKADSALYTYQQLSLNTSGEIAAEARYHISEIYLAQDSLKDAEEAANETIKLSAGNDYWIVKSYILLGDIFIKQKDYFNAKATLSSVVKHTRNAELKAEATKKLADVKVLEKQKSKLKEDQ